MADTPRSLSDLPSSLRNALARLGESERTTREDFATLIARYGYDAETSILLADQANRSYKPTPYPAPEARSQEAFQPNILGGGAILAGLGATAFAAATMDRSGAGEIISDINNKQLDELFKDGGALHDALVRGDTNAIKERLDLLDPDKLLDGQYELLKNRLEKAGADADTLKRIDEKHAERNNPNKSRRQLKIEEKEKKDLEARQKSLIKELDGLGDKKWFQKLSDKEKMATRTAILQRYAKGQLGRNDKHFRKLLSTRGFLGLGKKSSIPSVKKPIIRAIRKEDKEKRKKKQQQENSFEEQEDSENNDSSSDRLGEFRRIQRQIEHQQQAEQEAASYSAEEPSFSTESPEAPEASVPGVSPELPTPELPTDIPLEGAGAPAEGGAAIFANPWFWFVIVFIIILILIIVVIIYFKNNGGYDTDNYHQLQCGDMQDIGATNNPDSINKAFDNRFSAIIGTAWSNPSGPETTRLAENDAIVAVQSQLFSDICVLFGHVQGETYQDPNKPSTFNDFGTYTIGDPDLRKPENRGKLLDFRYVLYINSPQDTTCYLTFQSSPGGTLDLWAFHVLVAANNTIACSGGVPQFQFLVAQSLTHSLMLQQLHIQKQHTIKVYNDFVTYYDTAAPTATSKNISGIISYDGLLPTQGCQNGVDIGDNVLPDHQTVNCFSDMVGSYYTYPFYLDVPPVPTPTPAKTAPTPSPTATPQAFVNFPSAFPEYYNFAKTELFNGKDLVENISSSSGSQIADLATSVVNAFHDGPNPPCLKNKAGWTYLVFSNWGNDLGCKDHVSPIPSNVVWKWLSASTVQNLLLQCVGFVQAITAGANHFIGAGKGCAINYANPPYPPGYTFERVSIHHPRDFYDYSLAASLLPGDIVIWNWSGCGHIAVVTKVLEAAQRGGHPYAKFEVAEANALDDGAMDLRNQYSDFAIEGYYRLKSN